MAEHDDIVLHTRLEVAVAATASYWSAVQFAKKEQTLFDVVVGAVDWN